MKKLLALLLLPSLAFAAKIGENYVGFGIGHTTQSIDVRTSPNNLSWDAEYDGWAFSFGGNFNLSAPDKNKQWGADVLFSFSSADLEPNADAIDYLTAINSTNPSRDLEVNSLSGTLRPFITLGEGKLFCSLGFGRVENDDSKETGLVLGAGYEATFDKITITPSITHTSLDDGLTDSLSYGVSANYELTEKLDFVLGYSHTITDDVSFVYSGETVNLEPYANTFAFGLTYNF
jgi:hypothetical protein